METKRDQIINSILEALQKFERVTDVSSTYALLDRYLKTTNFGMQVFLLTQLLKRINKLKLEFPIAELFTRGDIPSFDDDPSAEFPIGDLILSSSIAKRYSISREDLNRSILISGSTGHGKTSLIFNILNKIRGAGINYLIFDMKRDYTSLLVYENTIYLDESTLKINPLEPPPNVSQVEWARHFADIFSNSFSLMIGSRDFLLDAILSFYREKTNEKPNSLGEFLNFLERSQVRSDYNRVTSGRIRSLLSSSEVFDCTVGVPISAWDNSNVIVSMDRLGLPEQNFIISFLLSYIFYMNINNPSRRGNLSKVVVIDDAHTVLDINKEKDYAMGVPILHSIISKIRELGVGFIFSDQQISSLMSSVIQNTNIKFIGRSNLTNDIERVIVDRTDQNLIQSIPKLNKGEFILMSGNVSPYALFKADRVRINKHLDSYITELKRLYNSDALKYTKSAKEIDDESLLLEEIIRNPFYDVESHFKKLSDKIDKERFKFSYSKLLSTGRISEVSIDVNGDRKSKFPYINKETNPSTINLSNPSYKSRFEKGLLEHLVKQELDLIGIQYEADGFGILLHGLRRAYIMFNANSRDLARILETRFNSVLDIVCDSEDKSLIISNLFKDSSIKSIANFSTLKVYHFVEFKSEWVARIKGRHSV